MKILKTILFSILVLAACDDGTEDPSDGGAGGVGGEGGAGGDGFPLAGNWLDDGSTRHEISETEWVQIFNGAASTFAILSISTEARQVLAQNDADNMFNPNLFSRFDWVAVGADLFYCQAAFDKASVDEAVAVPLSNATDPANGGCGDGNFKWSLLLPAE